MAGESALDLLQQSGGADQPLTTRAGPGKTEGSETEDQAPTLAEVRALIAESQTAAMRASQSLIDKQGDRFNTRLAQATKSVADTLANLEALGVKVTPEQQAALKNKATLEALQAQPDGLNTRGTGGSADTADQPGAGEQMDPGLAVGTLAVQMMEKSGVWIREGDAELTLIPKDVDVSDPEPFLKALALAIKTKAARIAGVKLPGAAETLAADETSPERPAGPGLNPRGKGDKAGKVPDGLDPLAYLRMGYEELAAGKGQ